MRQFSDKSRRENQNTLLCPIYIYIFENRGAYEMMWKKCCRSRQATDDNMAYVLCLLDNWSYKRTLGIWNIFHRNSGYANALSVTLRVHYLSCFLYNIHWLGLIMEILFYVRYEMN